MNPYMLLDGVHVALALVFQILWLVILAQVIMSWLVNFNVLNLRQPMVYKIWDLLNRILEPIYAPIRKVLPSFQGVDFTPMVVIIAMIFLQRLLGL
ncbi:YggT family protein [Rhodobacter capsulatus]|jgi:YggT family protein|uniref:YggT family protein n=1 Tax=Rhodobacter capsulatus (strain ATCC BAA-309 / NBRC 16581 / SB1003) TaxID=272942 RepID=D5AST7_RHOCB|nr:YggT family protein [Rhodobacter capsulatus]ADE87178.1 protein of unknown function YGGT, transmembrane [Rhodobacter capsulatus SB 1003]ETD03405.1 hypothetical protein U714_00385 [Rhodobacter capsulatus DE442]ETD78128.1 hypothetical protein U716_16540 [Rhodobacter capsulatus B6]ETD80200.1 hypothetical protein U717_00385 [Rhodobacter capsulatus R121]ETD82806.1 hypothetical protein U703_11340 [Rhodobacter capsulatus YW1]